MRRILKKCYARVKMAPVSLTMAMVCLAGFPIREMLRGWLGYSWVKQNFFLHPTLFTSWDHIDKLYTLITFPLAAVTFVDAVNGFVLFLLIGIVLEKRLSAKTLLLLFLVGLYLIPVASSFDLWLGGNQTSKIVYFGGVRHAAEAFKGALFALWVRNGRRFSILTHLLCGFLLLGYVVGLIQLMTGSWWIDNWGFFVIQPVTFMWILLKQKHQGVNQAI